MKLFEYEVLATLAGSVSGALLQYRLAAYKKRKAEPLSELCDLFGLGFDLSGY